jgi:hypothetical protein
MNHKHRAILHALFAHPISSNIDPKDVKAVLETLGAEITHGGHSHVVIKLNGHTHGFHETPHSLTKDEVAGVRKLLEDADIDPARDYPL